MLIINKAICNFCCYNNTFITVIYFCINIRFIIKMIICRILNGIIRYFRFYIINNKIDWRVLNVVSRIIICNYIIGEFAFQTFVCRNSKLNGPFRLI